MAGCLMAFLGDSRGQVAIHGRSLAARCFSFQSRILPAVAFVHRRAIRRRRLPRSLLSRRKTPLELDRKRSVPAETPGKTGTGVGDAFSPPKFSS
jgi:hypothetical protein